MRFASEFAREHLSHAGVNGDSHIKNFGVLYEDTDSPVVYSPTFDIFTTAVYQPFDTMALAMNGSKLFPRYKQLLKFGVIACKIPWSEVDIIIEKVGDAVATTRAELTRHIADFPTFRKVGESMLQCWETGVARINDRSSQGTC